MYIYFERIWNLSLRPHYKQKGKKERGNEKVSKRSLDTVPKAFNVNIFFQKRETPTIFQWKENFTLLTADSFMTAIWSIISKPISGMSLWNLPFSHWGANSLRCDFCEGQQHLLNSWRGHVHMAKQMWNLCALTFPHLGVVLFRELYNTMMQKQSEITELLPH